MIEHYVIGQLPSFEFAKKSLQLFTTVDSATDAECEYSKVTVKVPLVVAVRVWQLFCLNDKDSICTDYKTFEHL